MVTITVIMPVRNRPCIRTALESYRSQTYPYKQLVVVDGASTDATPAIAKTFLASTRGDILISEPDTGIYDALNKGLQVAHGDLIGVLHADDLYFSNDVLAQAAETVSSAGTPCVYGDLLYFKPTSTNLHISRYWKAGPYNPQRFRRGWMPPHPSTFFSRCVFRRYGSYRLDLGTAADYEFLLRTLFFGGLQATYIPRPLTCMRIGGMSNASLSARLRANRNDIRAWKVNNHRPPPLLSFFKPFRKIPQYFLPKPRGPSHCSPRSAQKT